MSLYLSELGIEHVRLFADTGWEAQETYEYLRGPLTAKLGPILETRGPKLMAELVASKGMFPSRIRRFCTEKLKVLPIKRWIDATYPDEDIVNAVGIRRGESQARAALDEWEYSESLDVDVWRPLIHWTEADVIAMHHRHGLPPNPLYLKGATRVGCWPCIFARKEEIALVAKIDPGRIDRIRQLETEVQAAAQARYDAKGETFESLGYMRPTFFVLSDAKPTQASKESASKRMFPIDEAVAWAKTSRGGKQLRLLETAPEGCVRWGLCETAAPEKEED